MSSPLPTPEQVTTALGGVNDPEIGRPITELGMVKSVSVGADGAGRRRRLPDRGRLPDARHDHLPGHHRGRRPARGHRRPGRPRRDVRGAAPGDADPAARRQGRAGDPVRPADVADPRLRGGERQGRRRQVLGHGEPGGGAGGLGLQGRPDRRRRLRALGAADARRHRASHQGREDDHASVVARREGDLDGHVQAAGQPADRVARADAGQGDAAVPGRRVLGRPRLPAARPAAGDRRRGDLARADAAERRAAGGDHPADRRGRGRRARGLDRRRRPSSGSSA